MATILIVEDDAALSYALSRTLMAAGHRVIAALDGMAALQKLEGSEPIDLLLVDLLMPKGHPHGVAIARMARQKRRDLSVIFMTGHPELPAQVEDGNVLLKPVDPNCLIQEIHARLSQVIGRA